MRVLVVEDDPHTRSALVDLISQDGNVCVAAENGEEAQHKFDTFDPELVCLDVMLPHTSGYELCRTFRKKRPTIPIIFITAKADEIDMVVGLELGGDDYIVKPFSGKEVLARIHAVCRRCFQLADDSGDSQSQPGQFQLGDLIVYPKKLRARRDNEHFELTIREVQFLTLLYENDGDVVSREVIFNACWGYSHIPNSRTLDQMVSQLRARVELDPKNPSIIRTVYGVGYRFERQP